jgi:hypothetical protein
MQNSLRTLILIALLPLAGALHAQMNAHIVCEGQSLQFTPESDYWGEPIWEYSADERVWENLVLEGQDVYEIQPAITGYYRLKLYDASCDSSFYSNVQFIEVRKWTKTLQMHSTHSGNEFNSGDSLYFWVDGDNLPEGVEFWVNQKQVHSTGGTDLLLPAMTQPFTVHATAGQGENCFTTDTLAYNTTSEGAKSQVPCEDPYPQVQNLSAEVSEALGGALLGWDVIAGSQGCRIRYRASGSETWVVQTLIEDELGNYLLPSGELTAGTTYQWQVRCGCSQNPFIAGPWSLVDVFNTPVPCEEPYPQVQNLNAVELSDQASVQLTWMSIQQSLGCQIQYREAGTSNNTTFQIYGPDLDAHMLSGNLLLPNTEYQWRIRCGCSESPLVAGPWSAWNYFETGSIVSPYPEGTVHCLPGGAAIVDVLNPATGKTWMDRNLGAAQLATASNDVAAYGDLYQWGRFSDGHQCRN